MKPIDSVEDLFVGWRDKNGFSVKVSYKRIFEASVVVPCVDPSKEKVLLIYGYLKFRVRFMFLGVVYILTSCPR